MRSKRAAEVLLRRRERKAPLQGDRAASKSAVKGTSWSWCPLPAVVQDPLGPAIRHFFWEPTKSEVKRTIPGLLCQRVVFTHRKSHHDRVGSTTTDRARMALSSGLRCNQLC